VLERALPGLGFTASPMTFVSYWLSHDSRLNRPLIDILQQLRATGAARLYIATNQEHLRAHWLWQTVGLGEVFDDMFYSARVGALKPGAEYFAFVKDRIGPQNEPPLFFDDSEEVVRAARGEGWEAVLFNTTADCTAHPWIAAQLATAC
jgi:putative hydrolase of the HAD superfamily